MSNIIPNARVPYYNIQQYIANARSNTTKTSADVIIPSYISDRRVISGINYSNLAYLKGLSTIEPSYPERYYYIETTTCIDPIIQKIYISPWIGYSLLYKKIKVTEMLLAGGLDIYQKMITIEHKQFRPGVRLISIQESGCILQLYNHLESVEYQTLKEVFIAMFKSGVNFYKPIDVKSQIMDQSSVVSNEAFCYRDIWDYLATKLEKLPPSMKTEREEFMKTIKDFIEEELKKVEDELEKPEIVQKKTDEEPIVG